VEVRSSEGLRRILEYRTQCKLTAGQSIRSQTSLSQERFDYLVCRKLDGGKRSTKTQAWLAKLYASKAQAANQELSTDQFVQTYSPRDYIAAGYREIMRTTKSALEALNLFGLNKRDVLARRFVTPEVPITFNARAGDNANTIVLDERIACCGTGEDSLDCHLWLLMMRDCPVCGLGACRASPPTLDRDSLGQLRHSEHSPTV
jgi:hypothetical protein